jgi:hypothetical protein
MERLRRYLELQAQAKSGLSSAFVAGGLLGVVSAAITFVFVLVAAFVWLSDRYDPLIAGLALGALFLLITIAALACCLWLRRRTIERAEIALAARRTATTWIDPKLLGPALQMSRAIGLRRMVPLLALGFLAAGVAMELSRRESREL